MAIDPNVLLRGVVPDAVGAAGRGFELGQAIRNAPILRQQREQQLAAGTQQAQSARLEQGQNQALVAFQLFGDTPITLDNFDQAVNLAEAQGIEISDAQRQASPENISMFNQVIQAGGQLAQAAGGDRKSQKGASFITKDKDNNLVVNTPVFNPFTNESTINRVPVTDQLVSRLGETGDEKTLRLINEAGGKTKAEREAKAETAGEVVAAEKSAIRGQGAIDTAFETGEGIPVLNRALDLLGSVKTGGFEQAKLRAAQTFGIEGADEGELSNLLGKAVLSQLRQTFGAAFTASEGEGLARIEAGFGKNPESNRRLLENALATTRRSVKRGIRAANRAGQNEEAADLQALLDATLDTPATQVTAESSGSVTISNQKEFDALPSGATFIEDGVTMVKD